MISPFFLKKGCRGQPPVVEEVCALRFDQRKWELAEWRYVFRSAYIAKGAEHREAYAAM